MSRLLLAVQYSVVLGFCLRKKFRKLTLPLISCVATFFVAAAVFFVMTLAFRAKVGTVSRGIYSIWWIVMASEALIIITVSCTWRMLSFKATHLPERLGLLTLIVIGEGAIGVSKTVSKIMGKNGPDLNNTFLIGCIVLILVS
jgi:low temperature requirement protein LtrA